MEQENNKTARKHRMPTTQHGYEDWLIRMIEKRTGSEFDEFLYPQVTAAAESWMMIQKIKKELMKQKSLTVISTGSQGQTKEDVNPLLPHFQKLQAELRLQLQALGLNWNATPSKITENTRKGVDEADPMAQFYTSAIGRTKR